MTQLLIGRFWNKIINILLCGRFVPSFSVLFTYWTCLHLYRIMDICIYIKYYVLININLHMIMSYSQILFCLVTIQKFPDLGNQLTSVFLWNATFIMCMLVCVCLRERWWGSTRGRSKRRGVGDWGYCVFSTASFTFKIIEASIISFFSEPIWLMNQYDLWL